MKATSSVFVVFNLTIGLALLLAGSALAVPTTTGPGGFGAADKPNPIAAEQLRQGVAPGSPRAGGAGRAAGATRADKILTVLVEFAGTDDIAGITYSGPLHNQIAKPVADDNTTYWIPDFSAAHYKEMLFGTSVGARSMSSYYLQQSGGSYTVQGSVYGWVSIPHSEAYYGSNDGARMPELVRNVVTALGNQVPWGEYDEDHDGVVDHLQIVHAGDEVAGSWTIWAHLSTLNPAVPTGDPGVAVGPYTIEPENSAIGVFCHEFGHNLGLPDLYDTSYGGEASTGFWP